MSCLFIAFFFITISLQNQCIIFENEENIQCSLINEPVCVVLKKGITKCRENQCKLTYLNKCEACKNKDIIQFMIDGECNKFPPNAIFCDPSFKEEFKCQQKNKSLFSIVYIIYTKFIFIYILYPNRLKSLRILQLKYQL